jgi:photosystem II stability/assembly factor-like uncharacterized protein
MNPGDPLYDALLELEASAPIGPLPPAPRPNRRPLWLAAGGVAVAAALAGAVIGTALLDRQRTGEATPSASATPASSVTPSPAPTSTPLATPTRAPTATPTPPATPSPEATLAPRTGWSVVSNAALEDVGRVDGVAEADGRLFALGSDTTVQPMIWYSDDGQTWRRAQVDDAPSDLGGQVKALVDAGDRLVAVATLGFAEGSGYFATILYSSDDGGQTWREVESTPGHTEAALFDLTRSDSRLVAVGSSVWTSDDDGRTWTETTAAAALNGTMRSVDATEDILLAAGMRGTDVTGPPALAWISRDRGDTWQRVVLEENAGATGALVASSGELLVTGYDAVGSERSYLWSSDDRGAGWARREVGDVTCCATGLVEAPAGIVIGIGSVEPYGVLASTDGQSWSFEPVAFRLLEVVWTPTFGLLAVTEDSEIVFAPEPYP